MLFVAINQLFERVLEFAGIYLEELFVGNALVECGHALVVRTCDLEFTAHRVLNYKVVS